MEQISKFFEKKHLPAIIAACFTLFLLPSPFSIIPALSDNGPSWHGLDCSFFMTTNYALTKGLTWGSDIIATYGPLAVLSHRVLWNIQKEYVLLFDLFMLFNFWYLFKDFLSQHRNLVSIIFLLAVLLLLNVHLGSTTSFIVFFFAVYWLREDSKKPGFFFILLSCLCISLCFYMKLNTAIFAVLIFLANLANTYLFKTLSGKRFIVYLLTLIGVIYLPSIWLKVDITAYIKGGFHILSGYNDIMYLEENHPAIELLVWITSFSLLFYFAGQILTRFRSKDFAAIFYLLVAMFYVFLAFKQSMLRNDINHLYEFSGSAVIVLFLANSNQNFVKNAYKRYLPLTVLTSLLLVIKLFVLPVSEIISWRLNAPIDFYKNYADAAGNNYFAETHKRHIPSEVLEQVENETIDIFPWDTEYLLQNKLNYLLRPAFQSYQVYNRFLQNANYESYLHNPPRFILYDYDAIDERYPLNEEGMTNTFITSNYSVADTFISNGRLIALLERNEKTSPVLTIKTREFSATIHDGVDVTEFDFVRISLTPHIKSKLLSLLYKPSELRINYILEDGSWHGYKTSPALLEAFVHTGKFVENTTDFIALFGQKHSLKNVVKIRLQDSASAFSEKINITGYNYYNSLTDSVWNLNYLDFGSDKIHDLNGEKVAALWNGSMSSKPVRLRKGQYSITLNVKGTPLNKIYPHVNVLVNGKKMSDFNATGNFELVNFDLLLDRSCRVSISLEMDNDANNAQTAEDRNLFVSGIHISKKK